MRKKYEKLFIDGKEIKKSRNIVITENSIIEGDKLKFNLIYKTKFNLLEIEEILIKCKTYETYLPFCFYKVTKVKTDERLEDYIKFRNKVKSVNPNCLEYIKIIFPDSEIKNELRKLQNKNKNKLTPYKVEYWLKKGFNIQEAEIKIKEYKSNKATTLKNFIKKYGEEKGQILFNEWVGNCVNTIESFKKKYGDNYKEKWETYLLSKDSSSFEWAFKKANNNFKKAIQIFNEKNKKTTTTYDKFLEKTCSAEEADKLYFEWCAKHDNSSIKYFLKKNKNEAVAFKKYSLHCSKKDSSSLNYFLKKYDYNYTLALLAFQKKKQKCDTASMYYCFKKCNRNIEEAKKMYSHLLTKRFKGKRYNASKESLKYFIKLYKILRLNGFERSDLYLGVKGSSEFFLYIEKHLRFYDFTILSKKIIIEFNGKVWHPNIEKYNYTELSENFKLVRKNFSLDDMIKKDKEKIDLAIKNGFSVLIIWEEDGFNKNWNKLINFLKNKKIL